MLTVSLGIPNKLLWEKKSYCVRVPLDINKKDQKQNPFEILTTKILQKRITSVSQKNWNEIPIAKKKILKSKSAIKEN